MIETHVRQLCMTSSKGGEVTEILEIADERVLMVVVHVGNDSLLCGHILCDRVCHCPWLLSGSYLDQELMCEGTSMINIIGDSIDWEEKERSGKMRGGDWG